MPDQDLAEFPPLVICVETPMSHVRVLWGSNYVTPSFVRTIIEDKKVPAFAWDMKLRELTRAETTPHTLL